MIYYIKDDFFERPLRKQEAPTIETEEAGLKPNPLLAGISFANPNLAKKQEKPLKVKDALKNMSLDGGGGNPEEGMTRREREAAEDLRRKEDYMRRHLAGETEAAKRDMAMVTDALNRCSYSLLFVRFDEMNV